MDTLYTVVMSQLVIDGPAYQTGALCEPILRSLPEWFGIEDALAQYVTDMERLPTFLAYDEGELLGFLTVKQHFDTTAELLVMGILPQAHRRGIGRALVVRAQAWLASQGVEYLQVKTLGPSHPDEGYAKTRAFYQALGFHPLEEFRQIWDEHNPCLIMIKKV